MLRVGMALSVAGCALALATPSGAQISTAAADDEMMPFFEKANVCLAAVDKKARDKKLPPETYKNVIDGACTEEIRNLRGLYSLHNVRSSNHDYLISRFDQNVVDARAKMVSDYAMR